MFLTPFYTVYTTGDLTTNTPADPQAREEAYSTSLYFPHNLHVLNASAQIGNHNEMQLALGGEVLQADSIPKGRRTLHKNKHDCAVTFHQKVLLRPQPPQTRQGHVSSFCSQKPGSECRNRAGKVSHVSSSVQEMWQSAKAAWVQIYHSPQLSPPHPPPQQPEGWDPLFSPVLFLHAQPGATE